MALLKLVHISLTVEGNMECQGNCEVSADGHVGVPQLVKIINHPIWSGLKFWYCQQAVRLDEKNGFELEYEVSNYYL